MPHASLVLIPTLGSEKELARATLLASLADLSPRGETLARFAQREWGPVPFPKSGRLVYSQRERDLCGIDWRGHSLRMGSILAVEEWVRSVGGFFPNQLHAIVAQIHRRGDVAWVVADLKSALGVICLPSCRTPRLRDCRLAGRPDGSRSAEAIQWRFGRQSFVR